jgi:hypothetical protein
MITPSPGLRGVMIGRGRLTVPCLSLSYVETGKGLLLKKKSKPIVSVDDHPESRSMKSNDRPGTFNCPLPVHFLRGNRLLLNNNNKKKKNLNTSKFLLKISIFPPHQTFSPIERSRKILPPFPLTKLPHFQSFSPLFRLQPTISGRLHCQPTFPHFPRPISPILT